MSGLQNTGPMTATGNAGDPDDFGPYRFTIRGTDTDYHDRLHLSSLFSFMQEAAYHNAKVLQIGADQLDKRGLCWLLIRISVRLHHLPHWGETVSVDTWSRGTQKLIFLRDFDFYDQNGLKFGSATSEWLIARQDTHRPQRPDVVLPPGHRPACTRAVFDHTIARPVPLAEASSVEPMLTQYADFSDIDRNKHVNNTRYIAWCVDTVYAARRRQIGKGGTAAVKQDADPDATPGFSDLPDLRISGLDIHYVNEVRIGTKIHCFCQTAELSSNDSSRDGANCEFLVEARRADDNVPVFRARVLTF